MAGSVIELLSKEPSSTWICARQTATAAATDPTRGLASTRNLTGLKQLLKALGFTLFKGTATVYNATGDLTASGKPYGSGVAAPLALSTDAGPLRLGTTVKVTNLANNRSIITEVTDRGNFGPGGKYLTGTYGIRVVDLPDNIANELGVTGDAPVAVEII